MRADRSPAACNRVLRLIIYYMDRIFRVLHVTGWQHIYRALEKHGIVIPEEYVREARYLETEDVAKQTEYLLDLPDKPTCIIYPDDTAAIGGINVIRSRGLRIPEDISIAGYDGTRVSQMLSPKLTTIRQDTDKIGREAADRLISIIKKPKTALVERAVVEGILLEGESVGRI